MEYSVFNKIPFDEFRLDFDDNNSLWITKGKDHKQSSQLKVYYGEYERGTKDRSTIIYTPKQGNSKGNYILKLKDGTYKEELFEFVSNETFNFQRDEDLIWVSNENKDKNKEKIREITSKISVHFIETQRLLDTNVQKVKTNITNVKTSQFAVENYSKEIAKLIQTRLAESAELSQSLDSSFPVRLVKYKQSYNLTKDEIRNKLKAIESKRARLKEAGILIDDTEGEFQGFELVKSFEDMEDTTRSILSVYVNDSELKLNFFDELLNKIELLKRLVKNKFAYKHLIISKEEGFIFKTDVEDTLSAGDLSSGEQHELVLLYQLLFKVKPNSLILIDEPELSLHVGWQMTFLHDLQEITKQNYIDLLIATHSPEIIDDNWDLTVKLRGPKS
jgi:predicted ATP-binding protein involved in virulence